MMSSFGELRRLIFKSSLIAILTKSVGAPVSYLMFLCLAKTMSLSDYGKFAFAFSLTLVLGKIGVAGQQQLMLKLLPTFEGPENLSVWRSATLFGLKRMAWTSTLAASALALYGFFTQGGGYLVAAALLVPLLAFSEFQSSMLRVRGNIVAALAPREIIWRLSIAIPAAILWLSNTPQISPKTTFMWAAITAAVVFTVQMFADSTTRYFSSLRGHKAPVQEEWRGTSWRFLVTSVLVFAAPSLAVVAIGTAFAPEQTGPFFAALKTAQLLQVFLLASNIIATPTISRHYGRGETSHVQEVCRSVAALSGFLSLAAFVGLVLFGRPILSYFGPSFDMAYPELLILAFGFAANALGGPNGVLLQMTGHEATYMKIILIVNGISVLAVFPAAYFGGTMEVAVVIASASIFWNVWSCVKCRQLVRVDPSVLSIFKKTA